MEIRQAYKFQLKPKYQQAVKMRQFAGCCRFTWNKALALEKSAYEETGKRLGYCRLAGALTEWKDSEETAFLKDAHSQILQQTLKDLYRAYVNFFEKRADFPRFKKKGLHDSFRYPQGFKVDENNSRIYLPKICWVRYRKSRQIEGIPKQATVSYACGTGMFPYKQRGQSRNGFTPRKRKSVLTWASQTLRCFPMERPLRH